MTPSMTCATRLFLLFWYLFVTISSCSAHESCCKFKLGVPSQEVPGLIDDVLDSAPAEWAGELRYIDDPKDSKPDDWDDEDDGDWSPVMILNPKYSWKPRQIPNPAYIAPPTYWDKLKVEIQASLPWVTLGVLITGGLSMLALPMESLEYWLQASQGESSGLKSFIQLLLAATLGLATPLCSCGALPLCTGLLKKGVPFASALAFLTASQSAGLDSSAITYGLLGSQAMLARLFGAIVLALAVGFACPPDTRRQPNAYLASKVASGMVNAPASIAGLLSGCLETATEIYPTVLLGLVLSTASLHYLPSLLSDVRSTSDASMHQDFWMRSILLGSAIPLQLCEHTSVTVASAVQKAGGSPGLAFAFLLSAPAINLPSILWMWSMCHRLRLVLILLTLYMTSLVLSYVVDAFRLDLLAGESTGEKPILPDLLVDSSPYLCGSMLVAGWYQQFLRSRSTATNGTCNTCCDE